MKKYNILLSLGMAALMASCSATKNTAKQTQSAVDEGNSVSSRLSTYKKMEFDRYYFDGIKEKMAGNFQRAAQNFAQAAELDPQSAAANYELGRTYVQMSEVQKAESSAQKALKLDPENKWYGMLLGDIYRYQKRFSDGAAIYEKLVEQHPQEAELYIDLAAFYLYDGKAAEAAKVYDRLEKQFGESEEISLQKHRIYFESGKLDKAIEEINKLIKRDPSSHNYQILAETYLKAGQEDKAFEVYNKLLEKNPDDGDIQLALAEYYYNKGDKTQSFELLKRAFANTSVSVDHKIGILYNNYLMQDKPTPENRADANTLTGILVKTHPEDAKTHAIYGDFLYQDKKLKEAREEYRKSLAIQNDIFAVWQQLFFIESELKDYAALQKETETAIEVFPSQPLVYFFNGLAKMEQKKYNDAIDILQSGLAMNVDNPNLEIQFYINLGEANYRLKKYPESDAQFDKALEVDPNNSLALNNYAYYLSVRNEQLDKAERMSKKTLAKEPDNASYQDTYGWILYKMGKYEEAAKYIKMSLDHDRESAEVAEHYGDVQYKLGNADTALEYWKKAKALGSTSQFIDKKIADKKLYE